MGLKMTGGTSGNREDGLAPVPSADGEYTYSKQAPSLPSTVVMKGGTSGDDSNYLPNIDVAFNRATPENTAKNASYPDVKLGYFTGNQQTGNESPPVPNCGTPNDAAI